MVGLHVGVSPRRSVLAATFVLLAAGPLEAGVGREIFRGHVSGNTTIKETTGSFPVSSTGISGSVDLVFSPFETLASRERSGATTVTLGTPITYKVTASVQVSLPGGPTETFSAQLDLSSGHGTKCKASPVTRAGLPGGSSATLSATVSCSESTVYMFWLTYASPFVTKASVSFTGNKGSSGGTSTQVTSVYEFLEDEIYAWNESPYAGTSLARGSKQTFKAQAKVSLQSKTRADLALRIYDQRGVLQGSSDFLSIGRDDVGTGVTYSLEAKDVLVEEKDVTQLTMRVAVIDPAQARVVMKSADFTYPIQFRCWLEGVLKREAGGKTYWMPDALVDVMDGDRVAVPAVKTKPDPEHPGVESFFCFAAPYSFDYTKSYTLRARLQDADDVTKGKVAVFPRLGADASDTSVKPATIVSKPFKIFKGAENKQDLLVTAAALGLKGLEGEKTEASAEAYWHLWRQASRMSPYFPDGFKLNESGPVRVYLNREGESWACPRGTDGSVRPCYCGSGTGCPAVYSIILGVGASMPGAHPSSLWHEFGHHLCHQLWASSDGPPRPEPNKRDSNHGGFYNDWTSDSMDEGFAYFWAVESRAVLDKDPSGIYHSNDPKPGNEGTPLQVNWKAWDFRRSVLSDAKVAAAFEDHAFAGLLLDLVDDDREWEPFPDVQFTRGGTTYTPWDSVSWDLKSLMTLFGQKQPPTILALHDELAKALPSSLTTPEGNPRGSGLSQLDEVFLMHRMFHDASGDWKYQFGEQIGRVANGASYLGGLEDDPVAPRPNRAEGSPIPGSFLGLRFVTAGGRELEGTEVKVERRFGGGLESLDSTSVLPVPAGKVYFPMPPPHYPVTMVVSVPGVDQQPVVFDQDAYRNALGKGETFLSATLTTPQPAPQLLAALPQRPVPGGLLTLSGKEFATPAGQNAVAFGELPASVSSGSDTELVVTVPPSIGEGTFPVTVTTSAGTSLPLDVAVVAPAVSVAPQALEFGTQYLGNLSEQTVTVTNAGAAPLTVVAAVASDRAFTVTSPAPPFTVDPGGKQAVKVGFRPQAAGSFGGTLYLSTDDPYNRVAALDVTGAGDSSRVGAQVDTNYGSMSFGTVVSGQSRTLELWVKSAGSGNLTVRSVTASHPAFTVAATTDPQPPISLKPYEQKGFTVRFAPASAGSFSGTLTVATDDPVQPTLLVPVQGTGVTGTASTCTYAVGPGRLSVPVEGGSAYFTLYSSSGCAWTLSPSGGVEVTSDLSGTGQVNVGLRMPANPLTTSRTATVTVQGLTVTIDQPGTEVASAAFVPIVLSSSGAAGSFYTSELTLTNRGTKDAVVEVTYTAAFGGGSGTAVDVLPAGVQRIFPDAMAYLRSLGVPLAASGNRGGTVGVRFHGVSSPTAASATVRTTTAVPQGRAGLAYPAVARALNEPAYLCGLRQNAFDRSNVAVMNTGAPGDGDIVVRLTVVSGDPAAPRVKALADIGLAPGGFSQVSQVLAAEGLSVTNGYVKVERVSGSAPFYAYGVINDQATSDGSFVPPLVASSLAGKAGLTLPVAVETGSYSTELVLTNLGTSPRTARLTYVAGAIQASGNAASIDLSLAAGEQKVIPSFVEELRRRGVPGVGPAGPTFAGAVFLTVPGGDVSGLALGARTSAPGGGGRFGLFYSAVPYGSAARQSAWLHGLQQDGENRSNLAIVNTGETDGSPSSFRIELFDGARGTLVKTLEGVSVAARGFGQLSSILAQHAPGTTSGYARVTRVSGSNPFLCYGVVNDGGEPGQRSDDGAFVPMDTSDEAAPRPSIAVSPASLDFGSVTVGQTADRTVEIANGGDAALHVAGLAASCAGFGLVSAGAPLTVAPGGKASVTVRFAPAAAGPATGSLSVASDDPDRPSVSVPLSGSGTAAATPRLALFPESLDFGKVSVGGGKDLSLVLGNPGGAPLVVSTLFVSHPAYTVNVASLPVTVAAGGQLAVTVRFAPLAAGVVSLGLLVGTNDPQRPSVSVPLTGEGIASTVTEDLAVDDGSIESGFAADGYFVVNRLTPSRYPATLRSIRLYLAQYTGKPSPAGSSVRVVAFTGPTGGAVPAPGGVFALDQVVTLPAVPSGGGGWVDLVLANGPVLASGDLYVGFRAPSTASGVLFPVDTNGTQRQRGYFSSDGGQTFRGPLVLVDSNTLVETNVNVMIRAQVTEPAP